MLLFRPGEHVEGEVGLSERAEHIRFGNGGGRPRGSGPQLVENLSCFGFAACNREGPPEDSEKVRRAIRHRDAVLRRREQVLRRIGEGVRDAKPRNPASP